MPDVRSGGALPNIPDAPGVYFILCAHAGESRHRLGEVLYVGFAQSIRRKVATVLGASGNGARQGPQKRMIEFQQRGGVAHLLFCPVLPQEGMDNLENALMRDLRERTGALPAWNAKGPRREEPPEASRQLAREILDKLRAR